MAVITNKSKRRYFRVLQSQVQAGRERRRGRGRAILLTRRASGANLCRGHMVALSSDYMIIYNYIITYYYYYYYYYSILPFPECSSVSARAAPISQVQSRRRAAAVPPPCRRRAAAVHGGASPACG